MIPIKKILLFSLLFLLFYGLLNFIVPKLGLDHSYSNMFVKLGNSWYKDYNGNGQVTFEKKAIDHNIFTHPFKEYDHEIYIKIINTDHIAQAQKEAAAIYRATKKVPNITVNHMEFTVDMWRDGWVPLILILSLILASPVPILRKLFALLLGGLLMNLFILFKFWTRFAVEVNRHGWLEVGTQSETVKHMFTYANTILLFFGINLVMAVVIWSMVTFRKKDLDRLNASGIF